MSSDEEKEEKKLGIIEVNELRDLLNLSSGPMGSIAKIHCFKIGTQNIYFLLGGIPGKKVNIYFVLLDEIKEKYIVRHTLSDEISFSDKIEAHPQRIFYPIIRVKRQNLIDVEQLEDFIKG